MTLSHAGSSQKKRRTRRRKVTGMPCQGRSAMVLVYRECVRAEPLPHRGQTEVASAEAALSVIRPALAERQMRSRFCESGRMVWFGIGDLGEWRNVGCPKQHARRFHRKPGRTKEGGKTGHVGWGVSENLLSRKLADQARLPTPRYRTGMRVYECGLPRTPSFYGIFL